MDLGVVLGIIIQNSKLNRASMAALNSNRRLRNEYAACIDEGREMLTDFNNMEEINTRLQEKIKQLSIEVATLKAQIMKLEEQNQQKSQSKAKRQKTNH